MRLKLEQLRATFPNQQWKEVYDWLFSLPPVREAIIERLVVEQVRTPPAAEALVPPR